MTLTVRLSNELQTRLNNLVMQTGHTQSYYVQAALEAYMEDLEDLLTANATLERIRSGQEKTFSLEEVERELNLES
nr:DUF6290 family protein [uncultured Haemophilus sp.]